MKKIFKKINVGIFSLVFLFGASIASAEKISEVKSSSIEKNLAVNFFFNDVIKDIFGSDVVEENKSASTSEAVLFNNEEGEEEILEKKIEKIEDKNTCEYFDNTVTNVLSLEAASSDAKQKIENVEETIESEASLRDSIFFSVKDFLGLQKKDKVIFREMKKDMSVAKSYYSDLDKKIDKTETFLDINICEELELKKIKEVNEETYNLVEDEATYRKQFVVSLKEKMKILQNSVKEAKK